MWKLELKIAESRMTKSWLKVWSNIIQALEMCNLREDDVQNVNLIVLNIMNEEDVSYRKDARKYGFVWWCEIIQNEYVQVSNDVNGELVEYFRIVN